MANFFKRWKQGLLDLSAVQQLHAKMVGFVGSTIGLVFAWGFLIARGLWFFSIVMFFAIWLNVISFIGARQQWKQACSFSPDDVMAADQQNLQKVLANMNDETLKDIDDGGKGEEE